MLWHAYAKGTAGICFRNKENKKSWLAGTNEGMSNAYLWAPANSIAKLLRSHIKAERTAEAKAATA